VHDWPASPPGSRGSENLELVGIGTAQGVVVQHDAADAPVLGQGAGLRFDLLSGEHAPHGNQQRVAVQQLQVPGELTGHADYRLMVWAWVVIGGVSLLSPLYNLRYPDLPHDPRQVLTRAVITLLELHS
jgi:hypothetical protein